MKTATLTGAELNCAVAMALGLKPIFCTNAPSGYSGTVEPYWATYNPAYHTYHPIREYARDITVAWPIIECEFICLNGDDGSPSVSPSWTASIFDDGETKVDGPTAIIAAMRCFVASVLGDEIELPTN